jgi:hypothetical protein
MVSAGGRFVLFFLWLLPAVIAVVSYYLWIIALMIMRGDRAMESALVLGGGYLLILIILSVITGMIRAVSASRSSKRQARILWGTTLVYFLIQLCIGPVVAIGWWYVSQRM